MIALEDTYFTMAAKSDQVKYILEQSKFMTLIRAYVFA